MRPKSVVIWPISPLIFRKAASILNVWPGGPFIWPGGPFIWPDEPSPSPGGLSDIVDSVT